MERRWEMDAREMTLPDRERENRVCAPGHVRLFDNFLRPLLHRPAKLFGPHVRAGSTVLDVGCGRGFASLGLAHLVGEEGEVVAADLQGEMLAMVQDRAERAGLSGRIRTHRCGSDRIGYTGQVDFVVAFWMVHELPDSRAFFEEVRKMLNPGGRLFVAEPYFHVSRRAFEATVETAGQAGFRVVDRPRVWFSRAVVLSREA
jgi:ubiquinone/menaquinone biosynthesis C-methylase UbiE